MPACSMLASIVLDVTGTGGMMRMNHFLGSMVFGVYCDILGYIDA